MGLGIILPALGGFQTRPYPRTMGATAEKRRSLLMFYLINSWFVYFVYLPSAF
jgi:hypothetical protein